MSYSPQLLVAVGVTCLGSLQYGYHMAELNAPEAILSCKVSVPSHSGFSWFSNHQYTCVPLDSSEIGFVTAIFSIGGLIGSAIASTISDLYGRKKSSYLNNSLFLIGSFIETFAQSKNFLLFGRFISGIGAGLSLVNTPVFINEMAHANSKGFLGSLNQFSINIGILFTQVLAIKWANDDQWRYLLNMGSLIAISNLICLSFISESPKWLVKNGQVSKAQKILKQLRFNPTESSIQEEIDQWLLEINGNNIINTNENDEENQTLLLNDKNLSLREYLFSPTYHNSRLVVFTIMPGQQFCGINSLIFYGVKVLSSLFPSHAISLNCGISILNVIVTYLSANLVDKLGRRPLLLFSVIVMGISSFLTADGILFDHSLLTIGGVFIYICSFALGLGPIPFLLISEVTQLKATTMAQSTGTVLNWLATFLIGWCFPILNDWIGGYVFGVFGVICLFMTSLIYNYYPETKGKKNYLEVWNENLD